MCGFETRYDIMESRREAKALLAIRWTSESKNSLGAIYKIVLKRGYDIDSRVKILNKYEK